MKAINIIWDADGETTNLPTEMEFPDNLFDGSYDDEVADYLSEQTGFCVESFDIVEDKDTEGLDEVKITLSLMVRREFREELKKIVDHHIDQLINLDEFPEIQSVFGCNMDYVAEIAIDTCFENRDGYAVPSYEVNYTDKDGNEKVATEAGTIYAKYGTEVSWNLTVKNAYKDNVFKFVYNDYDGKASGKGTKTATNTGSFTANKDVALSLGGSGNGYHYYGLLSSSVYFTVTTP